MESLLRSRIPLATPYQWNKDDDETDAAELALRGTSTTIGGREVGTGLAMIHRLTQNEETAEITEGGKEVLRELLRDSDVEGSEDSDPQKQRVVCERNDMLWYDKPIEGLAEQAVLDLAKEGRVSLFGSILRKFDEEALRSGGGEVSTPDVIRACSLAMRARDVPANMNAKEMIIAALSFLSSEMPCLSGTVLAGHSTNGDSRAGGGESSACGRDVVHETFPFMPLLDLSAAGQDEDLEKRAYVKNLRTPNGMWSMSDDEFRRKVVRLEMAFMSPTAANLGRIRSCPRLDAEAEYLLCCKGTEPNISKLKKDSGTGSKAEKSSATDSGKRKHGDMDSLDDPQAKLSRHGDY